MTFLILRSPSVMAQSPSPLSDVSSEVPDDLLGVLADKERLLQELIAKILSLRNVREQKEKEKLRLTTAIEILESRIQEARLEVDLTALTIEEVRLRIRENAAALVKIHGQEERIREQLIIVLRAMDAYDRRSVLETVLMQGTFTDFLQTREAYATLEQRATSLLVAAGDARAARELREKQLTDRRAELEELFRLQQAQKNSLGEEEQRKRQLLVQNVSQRARVASRIAEAEDARQEIQKELFTLRNAGIRLSLKQAKDFARFASRLTGVRPALLLGVLKVESNIGSNVGSGRYPADMHPAHREAFLRVVETLGLDPHTTPVSAKPTTYAGWGGAMGPGQIMPGTWERIVSTVAGLIGKKQPSPFDLGDAFVATAVILQGAGAAAGNEYEAVNRYFAGPNWQRFTWYGERVLAVAKEYEAKGL